MRRGLRPMPTRKVSADLARDAFGLIGLTIRNSSLKRFDELAVAAAVKDLADQCALGDAGGAGRSRSPARPGRPSGRRRRRRCPTGWAPCPTARHRPGGRRAGLRGPPGPPASRKSPWMKSTPSIGSNSSRSSAMIVPCSGPASPAPAAAPRPNLRRTYWLQAPGAAPRSTTSWPGPQQVQLLVDLLQLVGGAGPVALALRLLDVGVGQVVVQPRLVQLLALARVAIVLAVLAPIIGA